MLRRIILPVMLTVLSYGLWVSPDFVEIAAGVSIFLFAMLVMEQGFKALAGGVLEGILQRFTNRRWKSVVFGIVATSIMQSSSLVSVVAISFLSAGMITLAAGIGIVFGANLGTTTGAWLIAGFGLKVSISAYAMPLLVFGVVLIMQRAPNLRALGYVLAGLGFLFLGIHHMKGGFEAFRDQVDLAAYAIPGFRGLVVYVIFGIVATVIMQSSHATLVLVITAVSTGHVNYENALAIAIGSNIGTTVTAIIGALGANVEGKRLAAAHLVFNLVTGALAIAFIGPLVSFVNNCSRWLGIAADDYTLKLAVFHTLFNLGGVVIMLPLVTPLVTLLERHLKGREKTRAQPLYLSAAASDLPAAGVEAARKETLHLLSNAFEILAHGIGLHRRELVSSEPLESLVHRRSRPPEINIDARYERDVKPLFGAIVEYVSRVQGEQGANQIEELFALRKASQQIVEAVKGVKHLNKNLSRHMNSSNTLVQARYDSIRVGLGEVLRQVARLGTPTADTDSIQVLSYDDLKMEVSELSSQTMSELAEAMRDERIPALTATSIMNDAQYARTVGMGLIDVMQSLSSLGDQRKREVLGEITLASSDLEDLQSKDSSAAST